MLGITAQGERRYPRLEDGVSRRMTDTGKWRDPWFRKLTPVAKLLWCYLCDNCDGLGIIELDTEGASFDIGAPITQPVLDELESRIDRKGSKMLLKKFIDFQCVKLSDLCPAHKPILAGIEKYKLVRTDEGYLFPNGSLAVGLGKPSDTLSTDSPATSRFTKPSREELDAEAVKHKLAPKEVDRFVNYYESNGWKVGRNPMKSWKHALANWRTDEGSQSSPSGYKTKPTPLPEQNQIPETIHVRTL
jgi:hypothetical protein